MSQTIPLPEFNVITIFQEDLHPYLIGGLQRIREAAFKFTNKPSVQCWNKDIDQSEDTIHYAIEIETRGELVGSGRLQVKVGPDQGLASFSRIAIHPTHQGQGLGKAMIAHIISDVTRLAVSNNIPFQLTIEVRPHLVKFYSLRFGFEVTGHDGEYIIMDKTIEPTCRLHP